MGHKAFDNLFLRRPQIKRLYQLWSVLILNVRIGFYVIQNMVPAVINLVLPQFIRCQKTTSKAEDRNRTRNILSTNQARFLLRHPGMKKRVGYP